MTSYKIDPSPQVLYVQDEEGRENSLTQPFSPIVPVLAQGLAYVLRVHGGEACCIDFKIHVIFSIYCASPKYLNIYIYNL